MDEGAALLASATSASLSSTGYAAPPPLTPARRTEIRQALGVLDAVFIGEPGVLEVCETALKRFEDLGCAAVIDYRHEDVAELVATMCGPVFAKTTGAQVPIDGGNDRVI